MITNGGVIPTEPHGEYPQEYTDTDLWGRHKKREDRDVCSVITTDCDIGNVPSGGVTDKGDNLSRICRHLLYRHRKAKISILQEGPETLPRCDKCSMKKHKQTAIYNRVT